MTQQFILTATKNNKTTQVYGPVGSAQLVRIKQKQFKKEPQYKDYILQLRTVEGFKHVQILSSK